MTTNEERANEPEEMSLGRRAVQQGLPSGANPFTHRGRPGNRVHFHLWLAGYHAEMGRLAEKAEKV